MGRPVKDVPPGSQADRMRRLRLAMGCQTQTEFAKRYELGVTTVSNIENGFPISLRVAQQLSRAIPGLSIGWILDGATGDLSVGMARRLGEV